ncbi:MAG: UDP-N-acetylmuramate dehydrogenase [Clostridia bacterium]|jgi:UDP-N-acetylmuramate dehydrogenase|nr:UDP-N-acetylmuramate dehydrogenase [Clostridia bacterium]
MSIQKLYDFVQTEGLGEVLLEEPLSQHTTWRIGGPAEVFCQPKDWPACSQILAEARGLNIPVTFLGSGSNVLVADTGVKGLVLQTRNLNSMVWQEPEVWVESGVALATLSLQAGGKGLRGLEFACGIPGSVGGAAIMNAGAYGSSMSKVVKEVRILDLSGESRVYQNAELGYAYRTSILKHKAEIVVEVKFLLEAGDAHESKKQMEEYLANRKKKHPLHLPNAGSVFRNPPGIPAGRLIEEAGLKGKRVGDAQVSEQHGNFIVNLNQAKAADVLTLIEEVQQEVKKKKSITLETEVVFLGIKDNRR